MANTAPENLPIWATAEGALIQVPLPAKQEQGWTTSNNQPNGTGEKAPLQYFNWFMNLVYQWISFISTAMGSITQFGSMAEQNADAVDITGGTIDSTEIGQTTPAIGTFTSMISSGGTIDDTAIGQTTPDIATFTEAYDSGAVPTLANQLVNKAYVDNAIAANTLISGMTLGWMDELANIPTGWIPWTDGTIGNTGSGATILADPSTQTLFTKLWNASASVPANCPVLPQRGATAADDWAANCSITLPRANGCVVGILGAAVSAPPPVTSTRNFADTLGEEAHANTGDENGPHTHDITYYSTSGGESAPRIGQGPQAPGTFSTSSSGVGQPHNTMQPTTFIAWIVKL